MEECYWKPQTLNEMWMSQMRMTHRHANWKSSVPGLRVAQFLTVVHR